MKKPRLLDREVGKTTREILEQEEIRLSVKGPGLKSSIRPNK